MTEGDLETEEYYMLEAYRFSLKVGVNSILIIGPIYHQIYAGIILLTVRIFRVLVQI
jgi:hypothetical protein